MNSAKGKWRALIYPEEETIKGPTPRLRAMLHAESSTGVCRRLDDHARMAKESGAFLLVDMISSFNGMVVGLASRGTQKCKSHPLGLSPLSFGPATMDGLHRRKTKVSTWHLDLTVVKNSWEAERSYRYTEPAIMIDAFYEAFRAIAEERREGGRFWRSQVMP